MGRTCLGRMAGEGMSANEHILIAGAGIAGLGAALAFGDGKHRVTVLDRDPAPPDASPEEAFQTWERRGATQLRHSHAFLGRLTTLIARRYPELMKELLANGARIFNYQDALPPTLHDAYVPAAGDDELVFLFSRRTTLELVMRKYASHLPGVEFIADAGVRGLIAQRKKELLVVEGLQVEREGRVEEMRADAVIDATGRNSSFPDWLRAEGCEIAEEESPAGILYFTRHYRLRDGTDEPPRDGTPAAGDLGYIKFGVFVADNRHFSITLAIPEIESDLRMAAMKPEIFESICASIRGAARWTERAEPASQIFAMGNLKSVWRRYLKAGEPQALNFFAIGDAALRTNPLYGRGCSAGVVHAHILRDAFHMSENPRTRAIIFERETQKALRSFYETMVKQDIQAIRRAEHERDPNYRPRMKARIAKSFIEDGIVPATRGDLHVSRALSRSFHMLDPPAAWLKDADVMARIMKIWAMPERAKRARGFYPPKFGPNRNEMLARLGLA
jgi:2-polyprenyl-6-methoxyphenol hydroxylase-like FAD-dependent oxidoreductase